MTSSTKKLLDEAMSLSEDERRQLGQALLDSVSEESLEEVRKAWRDEVVSRIDEVRRGKAALEPWSEVKKHIREAIDHPKL